MKKLQLALLMALLLAVWTVACEDDEGPISPPPPPDKNYTYDLIEAFPGLTFLHITDIQSAGDGSGRLFVVEQDGRIQVISNTGVKSLFMDIDDRVEDGAAPSEVGLLGLAFHPDFATNGFFFVNYTNTDAGRVTRVSRFKIFGSAGDPGSEDIVLEFSQPFGNHNGGALDFDGDGMLLVATGDGGGSGDTQSNAQNRTNLLGNILRIDVHTDDTAPHYSIPADNPFEGNTDGYREEIFAWGLRNPWRISYDAASDRIWAGDVGQGTLEEIDVITSGGNFGWDCKEGTQPFGSPAPSCATVTDLIDPVFEYGRTLGFVVSGGYVYRGPTATSLSGKYIFADYDSGRIWAMSYDGATADVVELKDTNIKIPSFGIGENGEVYVGSGGSGGRLWLIEQTEIPEE